MKTLFRPISMLTLLASVLPMLSRLTHTLSRWQASPFFKPVLAALVMILAVVFDARAFLAAPVIFGVLTEGQHTGEFLLSELPGTISRDQVTVTVPASTTLQAGFVLGKLTGTGKYVPYDNAGSDGSESAAGILYGELVNDTVAPVDKAGTVINAWAEVRTADLVWASGLVDADETAGLADLLTKGIKARS